MMNGPFEGWNVWLTSFRPCITHFADIPQLAVGSIPKSARPRVFGCWSHQAQEQRRLERCKIQR